MKYTTGYNELFVQFQKEKKKYENQTSKKNTKFTIVLTYRVEGGRCDQRMILVMFYG